MRNLVSKKVVATAERRLKASMEPNQMVEPENTVFLALSGGSLASNEVTRKDLNRMRIFWLHQFATNWI